MHRKLLPLLSLMILLFTACVSNYEPEGVYLTDSAVFQLLPPSALPPLESYQLITGSFNGHDEMSAEAYLVIDSSKLDLTILTPTGQTIASVVFDGRSIDFHSPFVSARKLKSEYIIADIQLLLSSLDILKPELEAIGLDISEENGKRTLTSSGEVISTMTNQGGHVEVINALRGYTYSIDLL